MKNRITKLIEVINSEKKLKINSWFYNFLKNSAVCLVKGKIAGQLTQNLFKSVEMDFEKFGLK